MDLYAVPPPPRRPSLRARELIFRYQGSQKVMLLVGAIFVGIGLVLAIPFCWGVPADLTIAAGGSEQQGRVVSAHVDRSVTIMGRSPTVIRFAYFVQGQQYEAESSSLDPTLIQSARPGASIRIQVSGLVPQWARVSGSTRSIFGYGAMLMLFFPLLGLVGMGFAMRSNRREIRAFVHGQRAEAKVVFFGPDQTTQVNGRHPHRVDWEFRVGGEIHSGSLSSMSALALEDLGTASEITVLYLPEDPSVNTAWVA
jgi:hypothetical protein